MNKPAQSAVPGAISPGEKPPRTAAGAWFRRTTLSGETIQISMAQIPLFLIETTDSHRCTQILDQRPSVFIGGCTFFAWPTMCAQLIRSEDNEQVPISRLFWHSTEYDIMDQQTR